MRKSIYSNGDYVGILVWCSCYLRNFYFEIYTSVPDDFLGISADMDFECGDVVYDRAENGLDQSV